MYLDDGHDAIVALRKESVDRNIYPSQCRTLASVALRKESVDRNEGGNIDHPGGCSRSPQGERG